MLVGFPKTRHVGREKASVFNSFSVHALAGQAKNSRLALRRHDVAILPHCGVTSFRSMISDQGIRRGELQPISLFCSTKYPA